MPLHNYPRNQGGVCAGCDCADDSGGSYYATLIRAFCDASESISWTLCNVPEAWHNWVQAGAGPADGAETAAPIPAGEKYRIVPGQSDHLGIPETSCWVMTSATAKKSGCFENQIDFEDVFDDFGYDVPADVPDSGYVDGSGNADFTECCDENATDEDFFPLIPRRYVLKFRERGLKYSGTFWMQSTLGVSTARPPTVGAYNQSGYETDAFCSLLSAGFGTGAFFGGNHKVKQFGVRDWYSWDPEQTIRYVDIEHGADECFPAAPAGYPTKARVWWPTQQLHIDHEWKMECTLESTEAITGGYKATYTNDAAEWCFGDITTHSVCADPTAGGPSGAVAAAGMWTDTTTPSSWCDYQDSPAPYGSATVKVPRNISKIRGDGLKVDGTLTVEVCFMLPNTGSVPGPCDADSDFEQYGYSQGDGTGDPCGHRVSYPSTAVTAWFYPSDPTNDFQATAGAVYGWGQPGSTQEFAVTQVIGPGCQQDAAGDYPCHYPGACPGDSSPSGDPLLRWACFPTRFELRPYAHRALRTTDCANQGLVVDHDQVAVSPTQNGLRAGYTTMRKSGTPAVYGKADNGWIDEDYIPEPGVDSHIYGGTPWSAGGLLRYEMIGEWRDSGCGGNTENTGFVNTTTRHADGRKASGMAHAGNPYETWSVESECRCKRVDGSYRYDDLSGSVADTYDGPGENFDEPTYDWSDNYLIFEPHWD